MVEGGTSINKQTFLILLVVALSCVHAQVPTPAHIVIAILENHDNSTIIGAAAAPYINMLANDSLGALFTQSTALTHPSQPNYLMFFSGSNQGVTTDNVPSNLPFTTANLGGSLIAKGKTFTGYSEDEPSTGYIGATSGAYARKHNPWVNWQGTSINGIPASCNVPLSNFPAFYDSLPTVSFVIPNQNNDMHNGADPTTIATGDAWLKNHLDGYAQWAKSHNSLLILTFDENDNSAGNHITTLFVGQMVKRGQYSQQITHYNVLRTLEEMYGLSYAGGSANVAAISDCWITSVGTFVAIDHDEMASSFKLEQNYPDPFNPSTTIRYALPSRSSVKIIITNTLGQEVAVMQNGEQEAGYHEVEWRANVGSGVYFYRIDAGTLNDPNNRFMQVKKMLLLK